MFKNRDQEQQNDFLLHPLSTTFIALNLKAQSYCSLHKDIVNAL